MQALISMPLLASSISEAILPKKMLGEYEHKKISWIWYDGWSDGTCVGCFVVVESHAGGGGSARPFRPATGDDLPLDSIEADLLLCSDLLDGLFELLEAQLP